MPVKYTNKGLAFSDGSELEADVIVFCTGLEGNMCLMVAEIVGEEIAEQLDDYWHVDREGEVRGGLEADWSYVESFLLCCSEGSSLRLL